MNYDQWKESPYIESANDEAELERMEEALLEELKRGDDAIMKAYTTWLCGNDDTYATKLEWVMDEARRRWGRRQRG